LSNFQISENKCSGQLLAPQESCSLAVTYVPQPSTPTGTSGYLELNTQACTVGSAQPDCEIDSGRFPVRLTAGGLSPLRLSPGAGLDFGYQAKGIPGAPLVLTIYNDSKDPNAGVVTFKGTPLVQGDFVLLDQSAILPANNCGVSLASGDSCTLSIVFTPQSATFEQGSMAIVYTTPSFPTPRTQTIQLRGTGQ
jgi:hypothetical protein